MMIKLCSLLCILAFSVNLAHAYKTDPPTPSPTGPSKGKGKGKGDDGGKRGDDGGKKGSATKAPTGKKSPSKGKGGKGATPSPVKIKPAPTPHPTKFITPEPTDNPTESPTNSPPTKCEYFCRREHGNYMDEMARTYPKKAKYELDRRCIKCCESGRVYIDTCQYKEHRYGKGCRPKCVKERECSAVCALKYDFLHALDKKFSRFTIHRLARKCEECCDKGRPLVDKCPKWSPYDGNCKPTCEWK